MRSRPSNKDPMVKSDDVCPDGASKLSKTKLQFIEAIGKMCQEVGLPRSLGQIYGLIFLSAEPLSLDQISEDLLISKASASTGSRYLLALHAIRQVWIPGDRRDFFETRGELGDVLRSAYQNLFLVKLEKSERKLKEFIASLEEEHASGGIKDQEYDLCRKRFRQFERMQGKLRLLMPVLEKLL